MGFFTSTKARRRPRKARASSSTQDKIEIDNPDTTSFSRLEAALLNEEVERRPISRDGQVVMRHAESTDIDVNELNHKYEVDVNEFPYVNLDSAQELFAGVLYHEHLNKSQNFSEEINLECFSVQDSCAELLSLNGPALKELVQDATNRCNNVPALSTSIGDSLLRTASRKALIFFIPLIPTPKASFNYAIPLTRASTHDLFSSLSINPSFLMNMLGRPDYWAPQTRWDQEGKDFLGFDFYCQHPRWNIFNQGAPLSVYSKFDAQRNLTIYIISHNQNDTIVQALRAILDNAASHRAQDHISNVMLQSPLDIQVMVSNLNLEASKWHVARFRRKQWQAINKVDDHLAGLESSDRSKLKDLTKDLQIVSQNADSHIANAEVFLATARAIQKIAKRSSAFVQKRSRISNRTADAIEYAIASMEKQRRWFWNYKARKDGTMNLVYNLVTQQDALDNLNLATEMKKDSTSMKSIAAVTMVFLPGTFTASVFSAGIFGEKEGSLTAFEVTGMLWLWVVITLPITLVTVVCYWYYKRWTEREGQVQKEGVKKTKETIDG